MFKINTVESGCRSVHTFKSPARFDVVLLAHFSLLKNYSPIRSRLDLCVLPPSSPLRSCAIWIQVRAAQASKFSLPLATKNNLFIIWPGSFCRWRTKLLFIYSEAKSDFTEPLLCISPPLMPQSRNMRLTFRKKPRQVSVGFRWEHPGWLICRVCSKNVFVCPWMITLHRCNHSANKFNTHDQCFFL